MGNKLISHPRIVLTGTLMSHFKASDLERDVVPIIQEWQRRGAELCLDPMEFQRTFDVIIGSDGQFECFDSGGKGKVDAYEVLMVYILLATGEKSRKLEIAFGVFAFLNGSPATNYAINFDEAMIMLSSCVRGVSKVCLDAIKIQDAEVLFLCQSMFDMHRIPYTKPIEQKQFIDWCTMDPSPSSFVALFHTALEISDIRAQVNRINLEQAAIFQDLAFGQIIVSASALLENEPFQRSLQGPSPEELSTLINLMIDDKAKQTISSERFHQVLRPWNIFSECDLDGSHSLDEKELDILLWFQMRRRQSPEFVREFLDALDSDGDGEVSRMEWVAKIAGAGSSEPEKESENGSDNGNGGSPKTSKRRTLEQDKISLLLS